MTQGQDIQTQGLAPAGDIEVEGQVPPGQEVRALPWVGRPAAEALLGRKTPVE